MKQRFYRSLSVQLVAAVLLLLLPVVILSAVINHQFMRSGMQMVEQSHLTVLEGQRTWLDHELEMAENEMHERVCNDGSLLPLTDRSTTSFYYAANQFNREITRASLQYQCISAFFLYVPESELTYLYVRDGSIRGQSATLKQFLRTRMPALVEADTHWQRVDIGGSPYLMEGFYSNGIFGGSLLALDRLSELLQTDNGQRVGLCSGEDLETLRASLSPRSSLLSVPSQRCGQYLYALLDREDTLSSLPFLQRYIVIVTVLFCLSIPLLLMVLRKLIFAPLKRLTDAMQQVESGALDTRIDEQQSDTTEFRQIDRTFNHMVGEIHGLKIAVYERQLENEKTKLQNLSYQLRPHFMINSLNMAYNMILSGDRDNAARLMRFSAGYMRYLLRTEQDFVPLQEELAHLEDYMSIQLLRYEGQFSYRFEVDPFVEDIQIPSMVLQNFIENSIKYSIGGEHSTVIVLSVSYCEEHDIPAAEIVVRDNGGGYPNWLLTALEAEDMELLRERVGLRNTMQRIRMLYGDRAQYRFYNDGGAVTRFVFPLDEDG